MKNTLLIMLLFFCAFAMAQNVPEERELMGNNFQNISRLERGLITPTLFWVQNLADAFEFKLSDLIIEFEMFVKMQGKQK